ANLWAKNLDIDQVGVNDDFVALGGHSLLAIKLVSEINELYGVAVPLRMLLRGGTVASVAAAVNEYLLARSEGRAGARPAEVPRVQAAPSLVPLELPGGLQIVCPHRPEAEYLYVDVFEHRTYDQHGIRYPEGGTYFDVGANVGLFA